MKKLIQLMPALSVPWVLLLRSQMYVIDRKEARNYLSSFNFRAFFIELMGWDSAQPSPLVKTVEGKAFAFTTIAEKKGYTVLLCESIPSYPTRAKLDRLIAR